MVKIHILSILLPSEIIGIDKKNIYAILTKINLFKTWKVSKGQVISPRLKLLNTKVRIKTMVQEKILK